jgi:hypothetical protein
MSARWISSFSRHCDDLLVLSFKLFERFMWDIRRFLCGIFLNMISSVLKVCGLKNMMICTKMHIPVDPPLSDPSFHTEGETSSHSHNFQPHHF